MKIAIIGPGSMGLLYGGYLSRKNEVYLLGRDAEKMSQINENGIVCTEKDGTVVHFSCYATTNPKDIGIVEFVIVFLKAYNTAAVLDTCQALIGPNTILMTLQNGLGHEEILVHYANPENIIVGNTNQGSSRSNVYSITHSGLGDTFLGVISGDSCRFEDIRANFESCGFPCFLSNEVRKLIWNKLMINASSSVLSGILQTPQGYVVSNAFAWELAKKLIAELCAVATADGYPFDEAEQIARLENHLKAAPDGLTSIYNDLKNHCQTEVSFINGAVLSVAKKLGISVPTHEIVVSLVKAMEER